MKLRFFALLLLLLSLPALAQDAAPLDPAVLTATEIARLPLSSAPGGTASVIAPDGEHFMHVNFTTFCLYTIAGVQLRCSNVDEQVEELDMRVAVDPESIVWSPDGRFLVFAEMSLIYFVDSDIWLLDSETGVFTNLTDDSYDGDIGFGDDIPEATTVDLAPAWTPDGRITFVRYASIFDEHPPELWSMSPEGGEPEKLADLQPPSETAIFIYALDWSPDGSRMAFVIDHRSYSFGGLWLYDAASTEVEPLVIPPEDDPSFWRADFSPDGESLLLLTTQRDRSRARMTTTEADNGYFVVPAAGGAPVPIKSDLFVNSAGWLPDGGLIFTGHNYLDMLASGLFVTPSPDAEPRKIIDYPILDDRPITIFASTPRQIMPIDVTQNGRLLLGTTTDLTLIVQLSAE